ncbi:MAG: hypothetical protein UU81_C0043G0002 [Microgenomates group bacterium GW2011_GWC1_41_8]|uniref:Glycosyltransferase 2-like domain-containing protein n=3 Tax=Candidatus Roizmaniibacteriota TaxID=1752723 RepID=A0A0G0XEX7_9BACT|nr:MAG: hypothetical protein UU14_C0001G0033 [Candidatus Roizmanbacteria bacterium GW2011_GWB1_40_7]KKR94920.1 MAG: hypothetical protein UU41_C0002G0041 [Candidatus Roizmanbacteria bacterium GW2011_GWA1_41_13]KKS22992.1 MAG: hypothetical protein UU78_C0007G0010 [Candidatus Roizmanbacteria bacterium GW2011_GWC2_41_7]KKS23007.1 MAG: hypothetical protein UU81_C0043G0002 [Microgenomates group bacterium GW2011_GWC1_41_8]OGK48721.1 MAG: hypothetical protein A3A55_03270 [Candidatus Roizmanbacteria bac
MDKQQLLVSVIIVNWNGEHFLKDCLDSLFENTYKNIEVLFVDNASTDGSVSFVKKYYPSIQIIQNRENLGYAEGHEEAIHRSKGSLVMLLSTDTIMSSRVTETLVHAINRKKTIGVVMPKLLIMKPGKKLIDSIGAYILPTGMTYHIGREKNADDPRYNKPMEVYTIKGACALFRRSVLNKTGLFDKDYFAYFEETDLCHRIWLAGYRVMYDPSSYVYHKGAGASGEMVRSFIQFHSFKNRICTFIKNFSMKYLIRILPVTLIFYQGVFLYHLFVGDRSVAWAVQRAIWWNIVHIRQTLNKRQRIQAAIRTVSDDLFWENITRPVRLSYYYFMIKGLAHYTD